MGDKRVYGVWRGTTRNMVFLLGSALGWDRAEAYVKQWTMVHIRCTNTVSGHASFSESIPASQYGAATTFHEVYCTQVSSFCATSPWLSPPNLNLRTGADVIKGDCDRDLGFWAFVAVRRLFRLSAVPGGRESCTRLLHRLSGWM